MGVGDAVVTVVETPTGAEVLTALTNIRTTVGSSGTIGAFGLDGRVFCCGITEA